jgi:hypothetical protein
MFRRSLPIAIAEHLEALESHCAAIEAMALAGGDRPDFAVGVLLSLGEILLSCWCCHRFGAAEMCVIIPASLATTWEGWSERRPTFLLCRT